MPLWWHLENPIERHKGIEYMKISALREQRSAKVAAMKTLVDTAADAGRDLSADETAQFDGSVYLGGGR